MMINLFSQLRKIKLYNSILSRIVYIFTFFSESVNYIIINCKLIFLTLIRYNIILYYWEFFIYLPSSQLGQSISSRIVYLFPSSVEIKYTLKIVYLFPLKKEEVYCQTLYTYFLAQAGRNILSKIA